MGDKMSEIRWSDNDKIKEKDKMRSYGVHNMNDMHLGHPAELALSWTQLASAAWLRAGQLGRQLGWAECGLSCRTLAEL